MRVTLLTGCNLGDKEKNMQEVVVMIENRIGKVILKSSIYASAPWGFNSNDFFLNQALVCDTKQSPIDVLMTIWDIERLFGKQRDSKQEEINKLKLRQAGVTGYQSRNMDIDILFYDDLVINDELLTIPHKLYKTREFVLEPLSEIMGDYTPNGEQQTINEMLTRLKKD